MRACSHWSERERERERELRVHAIFSPSLSLSDRSTWCAHPLHWSEREREGERKRERESEKEGERTVLLFYFLKGMTGALAPFSYLVLE